MPVSYVSAVLVIIYAEIAAALITFYFAGITLGCFFSGLLSVTVSGWKLLMIGQLTIFAAIIILLVSKKLSVL